MRSKLFVPGTRPELFSKALAGPADAISIDMEDSVVEAKKEQVRQTIKEFLLSPIPSTVQKKIIVVRCNGINSPHFEADLMAIIRPQLDILNLPKIESPDDITRAVSFIKKAEQANGVVKPIPLLINIETPKGLRNAAGISASNERIVGLQLGLNDLFDSSGIDRNDIASVHTIMLMVRMAASEAGIKVYDGAYPDIGNMQGFLDETAMAISLGYSGKSCVHPNQVKAVNQMFMPSQEDIDLAEEIVRVASSSEKNGVGVFTVDGKMVDLPTIQRAKSILEKHKRNINSLNQI